MSYGHPMQTMKHIGSLITLPFFGLSMMVSLVAKYLLVRCLHQFGYVYAIPIPNFVVSSISIYRWFRYNIVSHVVIIRENAMKVSFHMQCFDGYL